MSKAAMNLQDSFLNQVRRENTEVKVLLVNGTGLRGIVKGFDNFTVILHNRNGQHLIYKHAIAQLVNQRQSAPKREGDESGAAESAASEETSREKGAQAQAPSQDRPRRDEHGQQNRPPRKEGFNRLDLSSVHLASEQEEKVESK